MIALADMMREVRLAVRGIRRNPRHASLIIILLGAGIGYSSAMLAVIEAVFLRPLSYPEAERLVRVAGLVAPRGQDRLAWWRRESRTLEHLGEYSTGSANLGAKDSLQRVWVSTISANLTEVFQIRPLLGRGFTVDDEQPGNHRVLLLSEGMWRQATGADPGILGQTVSLNGVPHTVVGVMPAVFAFPGATQVWLPRLRQSSGSVLLDSSEQPVLPLGLNQGFVARLRKGTSINAARQELTALLERTRRPGQAIGIISMVPLQDALVGAVRMPLWGLFAASGFLLLVACGGAGALILVRAVAQRQDVVIRYCLGAGVGRVWLQALIDGAVLSMLSGLLGAIIAFGCAKAVRNLAPPNLPRLAEVGISPSVLLFCFSMAFLVNLGASGSRAWVAPLSGMSNVWRPAGSRAGSRMSQRARWILTVAQMAFTFVLLAVEGQSVRSLMRLQQVDTGFEPRQLVTAQIGMSRPFKTVADLATYQASLMERGGLLHVPFGIVDKAPLSGGSGAFLSFRPADQPGEVMALTSMIGGAYFEAMGIPLLAGRTFDRGDHQNAIPVVIVNQSMAAMISPGAEQAAVGKSVEIGGQNRQVVGVVRNVKFADLGEAPEPQMYFPFLQPYQPDVSRVNLTIAIRTATDSQTLAPALRAMLSGVDRDATLYGIQRGWDRVNASNSPVRFRTTFLGVSAAVAFVIGVLGVYGMMAYSVERRLPEFGVRLALGQLPRSAAAQVVAESAKIGIAGTALGAVLGVAATTAVSSLLFGAARVEPGIQALAGLLLLAGSIAAALGPARRVLSIDVANTLRFE